MPFHREIGRVTLALLAGFLLVGLAAAYWAVTGPDSLLRRGDNPRLVLANEAVARGALLDREGGLLAETQRTEGEFTRQYQGFGNAGLLGDVVGGFGINGIEAAFDELLRGEPVDAGQQALRDLLHQPRPGADVRLTLDPGVQLALLEAMGDQAGAAIVLSIPDGEVLALVSHPVTASTPVMNHALQGQFPAGGMLIPGMLSAALLQGLDISQAAYPAEGCAVRLADGQLISLQEGFLFACVGPFESIAASMTPSALASMLGAFAVQPVNGVVGDLLSGSPQATPAADPVDLATVTMSPLSAVLMTAAIVNDGSAASPVLAQAYRAAGSDEWTPLINTSPVIPVTTAATARRLQDLMRQAVAEGAALNAGRARLDIGGLAALGGTEDAPVSWFTGFISLPDGRSAVVAVVLDGQRDAGLAAGIGGAALESAANLVSEG